MRPALYLAGKIGPHDFRHDLIPPLRGYRHEYGPLDCGRFDYVGPFFECCDHGCTHGPGSHGVLGQPGLGCEEYPRTTQHRVWQRNARAVREATAVFAYIEANDAYGSLVEIGWAQERGTPLGIVFAPDVDADQMWYATMGHRRGKSTSTRGVHRKDLPWHFNAFVGSLQP
jgi:hypothetical protein